jgi:hypothetical protein
MIPHSITLSEDLGKAISDAFKEAEVGGQREITLRIPLPREKQGTLIDKLRTRGTPIELIASYLHAEDEKQALAAFHSSVLEYVYEKLAEDLNAKVGFITRGQLTCDHDDHPDTPDTPPTCDDLYLPVLVEPDRTNIGIALEPAHDNIISKESTLPVPVGRLRSGAIAGYICDDYNASVITLIDAVTTSIVKQITTQIEKARHIVPEGTLKIFIVPEMSASTLVIDQARRAPVRLGGETKIVACAFIVEEKPTK